MIIAINGQMWSTLPLVVEMYLGMQKKILMQQVGEALTKLTNLKVQLGGWILI